MHAYEEDATDTSADRVRRSTPLQLNREIDRRTDANILSYMNSNEATIVKRIRELDSEWDVERVLEVNASTLALTGLALGIGMNRKWLALPAVVLAFLFRHGVQGWCPPLPVLRRLDVRTHGENERKNTG